jgi:hypothetical protein
MILGLSAVYSSRHVGQHSSSSSPTSNDCDRRCLHLPARRGPRHSRSTHTQSSHVRARLKEVGAPSAWAPLSLSVSSGDGLRGGGSSGVGSGVSNLPPPPEDVGLLGDRSDDDDALPSGSSDNSADPDLRESPRTQVSE